MNIIYSVQLGEATGSEPVTLTEAKAQLKLSTTADDTLITALITAARLQIEQYCGVSIVGREVNLVCKLDACNMFELPYGPVTTATISATLLRVSAGGTDTLLTTDDYLIYGDHFVNFLPQTSGGFFAITYDAGYTNVPQALKEAVLHQVAYLYEHRGDEDTEGLSTTARMLAKTYRRVVI